MNRRITMMGIGFMWVKLEQRMRWYKFIPTSIIMSIENEEIQGFSNILI